MKPQSLISRVDDNHCKFRDFTYLRSAASCTEESFSHNCATGTQVLLPLFPPAFIFQLTLVVSQLPPLPTPSVHPPLQKTKASPTHFRPRPWLAESPLGFFIFLFVTTKLLTQAVGGGGRGRKVASADSKWSVLKQKRSRTKYPVIPATAGATKPQVCDPFCREKDLALANSLHKWGFLNRISWYSKQK